MNYLSVANYLFTYKKNTYIYVCVCVCVCARARQNHSRSIVSDSYGRGVQTIIWRGTEERGAVIGQTHFSGGGRQPWLPLDVLGERLAQRQPAGEGEGEEASSKGAL